MGDAADDLDFAITEAKFAHLRGDCEFGCQWCESESEDENEHKRAPKRRVDSIERSRQLLNHRIEEFASFGIRACDKSGGILGSLMLTATEAEKTLKLLRRLRRLESRKK